MVIYISSLRKSLNRHHKCDSGVVGNARPCQGRDRGFEPRLSLLEHQLKLMLFSFPSTTSTFHNYSNSISANNIYSQYPSFKRIFAIEAGYLLDSVKSITSAGHYMFLPAFAGVLEKVSARKSALCKKISLSEPHLRRV